jgi:predicted enzyme related to lactoylglutathione lyase
MAKSKKNAAKIIWFEIPVDDAKRASKFYSSLFGWKIKAMPHMKDYWHIDTGGHEETPDGGLIPRMCPEHPITNYINVASVEKASAKVKKLGGVIHKPKTAVPGMGYLAICQDTEKNVFAVWEMNPKAK